MIVAALASFTKVGPRSSSATVSVELPLVTLLPVASVLPEPVVGLTDALETPNSTTVQSSMLCNNFLACRLHGL
jgi:hypothetical protein